jgi:hypothetical protein
MEFEGIEDELRHLLVQYGPPRKSVHPEYPFWRLQSYGLWQVEGGSALSRRGNEQVNEWRWGTVCSMPGSGQSDRISRHGSTHVHKMQIDGGKEEQVISAETGAAEAELKSPPTRDPGVNTVSFTLDGKALILEDLRSGAANLWAFPIFGGGSPKQMTFYNSGLVWGY